MRDIAELERRLPAFLRTGPRSGRVALDEHVVEVELPRFGLIEARITTTELDGAYACFRRAGAAPSQSYVGHTNTLDAGDLVIETTDVALAAAWLDSSITLALEEPLATASFVLTGSHVEVHTRGGVAPGDLDQLAASIACAAVIATRPARFVTEWLAATDHVGGRATAGRWGIGNDFAVVVRREGVDVVIDSVRRLPGERDADARLRTRARAEIPAHLGTLSELCVKHTRRVAALGPSALVRDRDEVWVVRDGLVLDRAALDAAIDLLVALALEHRGPRSAGPYR